MSGGRAFYENDKFQFTFNNFDYVASLSAEADWSYDAGRWWMPNGDPGYPPSEDFDITDVKVKWCRNKDTDEEVAVTDGMREAIDDALYDTDYNDWSGYCDDGPEYDEPECDPWEED